MLLNGYVAHPWLHWYHAHVHCYFIMLLWLSSSPFKLNLTLIELEQICWLSHGATESSSPVQPHLPGWGGPNAVYCHASRWNLQLGKVMGVRYPDQVGGHKTCVPELCCTRVSPFGTSLFWPRRWRPQRWQMSWVDIRATQDIAQRGVCREWPGECHAIDWFCQNVVGPPEWEHEAMSSVVWVQCTNLCRVYNLSIAVSSVMDTVRSRSHYGSTEIIIWIITTPVRWEKKLVDLYVVTSWSWWYSWWWLIMRWSCDDHDSKKDWYIWWLRDNLRAE